MKQRHIVFLIICASWLTLLTSYGMNTELGKEQGLSLTLGQNVATLLPITIVYYIVFYLSDKTKHSKQRNALQHS